MFLEIMDYSGARTKTPIDIDNLKDVLSLYIRVISGDEILTVIYRNGKIERYDSSDSRCMDFYDDEYCLYNEFEKINLIPEFQNRKSSYWR